MHFIQAIKGGFVTKMLNVTRGRPSLTFKKLEDVYEVLDAKNHDLLPTLQDKDKSESCHVIVIQLRSKVHGYIQWKEELSKGSLKLLTYIAMVATMELIMTWLI